MALIVLHLSGDKSCDWYYSGTSPEIGNVLGQDGLSQLKLEPEFGKIPHERGVISMRRCGQRGFGKWEFDEWEFDEWELGEYGALRELWGFAERGFEGRKEESDGKKFAGWRGVRLRGGEE